MEASPRNHRSNRDERRARIGLILVVIGALALLSQVGLFQGIGDWVGAIIFAVLGALVLRHYQQRGRVAALVGAFTLFGLAAASIGGALSGLLFLGFVGAGFLTVYLRERRRWWAIIPAGTMFSLAVVAGLDELSPGYDASWVLFVGLAATFFFLYELPGDPQRWAIYPAIASAALVVLSLSIGGTWLLPIALVVLGVSLLLRRDDVARGRGGAAGSADSGGGSAPTEGDEGRTGEP